MPVPLKISSFVLAAGSLVLSGSLGCAGPQPKTRGASVEPTTCIGGLCVRPDHTIARKVRAERGTRCMILAWDGDAMLPPTAKVGVTDESPARPGVFLAVEVPRMLAGVPYRISREKDTGPSVLSVRVDPAVRFADQRIAEKGEVVLASAGEDLLVRVTTVWGTHQEDALIVVSRANNGCGTPLTVD